MVTIDLNTEQRWDEIFQRVEAGEVVQVMRGDRLIAFVDPAPGIEPENHGIAIAAEKELPHVWPSEQLVEDEGYLDYLAQLGLKRLGKISSADDFADWVKPQSK